MRLRLEGRRRRDIHQDLVSAIGDHAPTITMVRGWVKEFQGGRTCVEDESRSGRPVTACGDAIVKAAVEEDKRKTVRELSEEVSMPCTSLYIIF